MTTTPDTATLRWIGRGSIIDWRKYYECSRCGKAWVK